MGIISWITLRPAASQPANMPNPGRPGRSRPAGRHAHR
jgi:hypothetical protein